MCIRDRLNYDLQDMAYEALGKYDGAIVVMEPSTGKILAMVSKPDYDPNNIAEDWDELTAEDSESSVLLNLSLIHILLKRYRTVTGLWI